MESWLAVLVIPALAFIPMLLYALFLWWLDRYEKEPLRFILAAFFWGAVPAIIFSAIAQFALDVPASPGTELETELLGAGLIAPLTEEPFKALLLLFLVLRHRHEIDTPLDGILYGGLVGFGFASTENLVYFLGAYEMEGLGGVFLLALFRAVLFGLNHALFTGCTGLGFALARTAAQRWLRWTAPVLGLGLGITLHAVHNVGATLASVACWPILVSALSDWGGALALLGLTVYISLRERSWLVRYLADEVEAHILSPQDYETITSYWRRVAERSRALLRGDLARWWRLGKYYRLASELAFARRRFQVVGADAETDRRIYRLRREILALREELAREA